MWCVVSKHNPCNANASRRRKIRARIAARGEPCAICGMPIDYSLPAGDDWAFEVDEIVSRWKGGNPLDISNCQPVHRACNRIKYQRERAEAEQKRNTPPIPPKASRRW